MLYYLTVTDKSDVYSFGVVLLEILCARPAINNLLPMEEMNLVDWGMLWQRKGQLEKIIDLVLVDKIKPSSLRKFGETAEKRLKANSVERPKMRKCYMTCNMHCGFKKLQCIEIHMKTAQQILHWSCSCLLFRICLLIEHRSRKMIMHPLEEMMILIQRLVKVQPQLRIDGCQLLV